MDGVTSTFGRCVNFSEWLIIHYGLYCPSFERSFKVVMNSIAILMAMKAEAKQIIEKLNLVSIEGGFDSRLPFEIYKGTVEKAEINLVINGKDKTFGVDNVGTQPATLATYITIDRFNPDLLINAGTAGGFQEKGASIGTVYIINECFSFHDRRIPVPGFQEYGVGNYPGASVDGISAKLNLVPGMVSTGNSLDIMDRDLEIIEQNNADVKDMEAAAIAWVAALYEKPFIALKSVTDLIDMNSPTEEQFVNNLDIATGNLSKAVVDVIHYCLNNQPRAFQI